MPVCLTMPPRKKLHRLSNMALRLLNSTTNRLPRLHRKLSGRQKRLERRFWFSLADHTTLTRKSITASISSSAALAWQSLPKTALPDSHTHRNCRHSTSGHTTPECIGLPSMSQHSRISNWYSWYRSAAALMPSPRTKSAGFSNRAENFIPS